MDLKGAFAMERFENGVRDLRSALEFLRKRPGQLVETEVEVDPEAELSGVYRYVGAGGTVMRPTRTNGPAMLFRNLKGFDEASAVIGVLASRERVAALLGCRSADLGRLLCECVAGPVEPLLSEAPAECQQVVHLASEPGFDLRRLLPAPTNTPVDAGPYITLGMCYATHPDTGRSDVTIHRLCIQGRDELSIAGALRGEPVRLCRCVSVDERAIANAEFVIEGEIVPGVRVQEDQNSGTGYAMPEFPGYNGAASSERGAGVQREHSGPGHFLQDDLRLHGAVCAEGAL